MPKGQDQGGVLDRLRRRIDNYRKRHEDVVPRFDNTISSQNQQQKQDTLLLRQRFIETSKAKKSAKKSDKNKHSSDGVGGSIGPSKSNKRQNEDDQGGAEGYEPPSKIGGAGRSSSSPLPSNPTNSSLYKQGFSQNGKRGGNKTKGLDSQKYQASSSNHPKNGIGRIPQPPPPTIPPNASNFSQCRSSGNTQSTNSSVPEFKKETNTPSLSDFADLDQCAAALEKDAAKNGAITGSFIGENSNDEIFNSDVFNDLISEISDLNPDVMSNFYLEDGPSSDDLSDVTLHGSGAATGTANGTCNTNEPFHPVTPVTPTTSSPMRSSTLSHGHLSGIKMEGGSVDGTSLGVHGMDRGLSHCAGPSPAPASTASPLASQLGSSSSHLPSPSQSYTNSHFVLDNGQTGSPLNSTGLVNSCNSATSMAKPSTRLPYTSPAGLTVDSPAAQTLKHMAEQHQHKAQMCMSTSNTTNGGVTFKNQGSVGSPAGSPYGTIGNFNGNMPSDFPGPTNGMNPGSNCQVKQEVCSPGNPQQGFSPSPMMVEMASGVKRPGQHNSSSPSGQSARMPNMNSAGGSPIMSPISKSFNHPSPLNTGPNNQGPIPPQPQPQQAQQPYMPLNRLPGPSQPYPNVNPRYPSTNNSQISVASPKSVGASQGHQISDRGSPATQIDSKPQMRVGIQNQNPQQQQFTQQQQFQYGGSPNNSIPVEMGFNPGSHPQNSQMPPQHPQQQSGSGQTINFTQQHLRMGNQVGMPISRMQMPPMNRMGVPQRLPGSTMSDMQQQQQQSQQQRPLLDQNQHPQQRMMRPPQSQHPRHNLLPPHQQQMSMGGMPPGQPQMNSGSGMGGQMMNRFPGMPGNPQMMSQQQQHSQQAYGMGGNMPMSAPGNPNNGGMPMRRPYGPGPGFQGMNPRPPSDQMLSSGSQNPLTSMGNSGVPHGEWMGNINTMQDGSCPPQYSGPQRHPPTQAQMRPQQFHSGIPPNQGAPGQGPPQLSGDFGQPHEHMMGQQNTNYNMGVSVQSHSQQQQLHHQQQQQQQQLPPNFSQHAATGSNGMKMGMPGHLHPQQQQAMYSNSNSGFAAKSPDNGMMRPSQNSVAHHQQLQQQQQQPPPHAQQHNMYNMGGMMNAGGPQVNNNMSMQEHQDFDLNLLVDGMRGGGDQDQGFNDPDLLNTLDAVFH